MKEATSVYNGLLLICSFTIALLIAEVALRLGSHSGYYVWPQNQKVVLQPAPGVLPGITGDSLFLTNEAGMRGRSLSARYSYRILAVGGSTTECLYLDQSETWPHLLQETLNKEQQDPQVWVGNVGKSGLNTRHHIIQIEKLLDQYPSVDLVTLMVGVNDMLLRLGQDERYRPLSQEGSTYQRKLEKQAFAIVPGWDASYPLYKQTEIWRILRKVKQRLLDNSPRVPAQLVQDKAGNFYAAGRTRRRNASRILDALPDLSTALIEYKQNINRIVDIVEQRNGQILIMTQPSMWRTNLSEDLSSLLLWGEVIERNRTRGVTEYYSVEALAEGMKIYNSALLEVCKQRSIHCVDLASALPKDDSVFYDDMHFNESGA